MRLLRYTASLNGYSISAVNILTIVVLYTAMLTSCSAEQNNVTDSQGFILPVVSIDSTLKYWNSEQTLEIDTAEIPDVEELTLSLATSDSRFSHTWTTFSEYNPDQSFMSGDYTLSFSTSSELIEKGYVNLGAQQKFTLHSGENLNIPVLLKPMVARVECYSSKTRGANFSLNTIGVHGSMGDYRYLPVKEDILSGHTYISPGDTYILAQLINSEGKELVILTDATISLGVAQVVETIVEIENDNLSINFGGAKTTTKIDANLFDVAIPRLEAVGFDPTKTFQAVEGVALENPFVVNVDASRALKHLFMTVNSPLYGDVNVREYDLIENGLPNLIVDISDDGQTAKVDFTQIIENVATRYAASTRISLMAVDDLGLCSDLLSFEIITSTVDFSLMSTTPAVIGINQASITMSSSSPLVEMSDFKIQTKDEQGNVVACAICGMHTNSDNTLVTIDFEIPVGVKSIDVDVYYMGIKRLDAIIHRSNPQFAMSFDTYATTCYVHIDADNDNIIKSIVDMASFMANGERVTIWERYPEDGIVVLSGLTPSTQYIIEAKFASLDVAASAHTRTEDAEQVPDADFEDVEEIIDYKHLPSGGRYSATDLYIMNRQNYVDISVLWPKKYWASVNAKTFNPMASNVNTWYMQPSSEIVYESVSGTKSIKISSVGWSLDGGAIPDYIQKSGEYLPYNNNVPKVNHRSAGRLFLGSYEFDTETMQEKYVEGLTFASRPSSLNGFFKYQPDLDNPTDRGRVNIKLYGEQNTNEEILIAEGVGIFRFAPDFTAFNVPLVYNVRGVKASRICIMFVSTVGAGTIVEEDQNVSLTPYPDKSSMRGSTLWIDNLSLSY